MIIEGPCKYRFQEILLPKTSIANVEGVVKTEETPGSWTVICLINKGVPCDHPCESQRTCERSRARLLERPH